jgi:ferredoxin
VVSDSPQIRRHRKMVLELLLGIAPDAPVVAGLARANGVESPRFAAAGPPAGRARCILCGLCARVCDEVVGAAAISLTGRGERKGLEVPYRERVADSCVGCGACGAVCPTGAIELESVKVARLRERPATERPCRYALLGLMPGALCPNDYDCAICEVDQRFVETCRPYHPAFAARGLVTPAEWEE